MSILRSRRLDALLGASLSDARYSHFEALAAGQVSETYDLDFKGSLYERSDKGKQELAKDVAALANSAGGILILGIEEDKQARASASPGVVISDAEISRMRQVVASLVAPLPAFEILPVVKPGETDHGFLVIAVPPSPLSPHAVLAGGGLRFPHRHGATTRYLAEPEVATAYRHRFARAEEQSTRAERVETALGTRLQQGDGQVWVSVSLVPDVPGDVPIDQGSLAALRSEIFKNCPFPAILQSNYSWHRIEVAARRLLFSGSRDGGWQTRWLAADLWDDGAGAFAMNAAAAGGPTPATPEPSAWLHDEQLVNAVMSGLRFLGRHARDRAGATGDGLLRAMIHADNLSHAVCLTAGSRNFGDGMGRPLHVPASTAEAAAPLDSLADNGPALLAATYLLATGLLQEFGLPEVPQLTRDGQLRREYWTKAWLPDLERWAAGAGVSMTDEVLPN